MINRTPEAIIAKLILGVAGMTFLVLAFSWQAAVGIMCLLSAFTWELRNPGKDR